MFFQTLFFKFFSIVIPKDPRHTSLGIPAPIHQWAETHGCLRPTQGHCADHAISKPLNTFNLPFLCLQLHGESFVTQKLENKPLFLKKET